MDGGEIAIMIGIDQVSDYLLTMFINSMHQFL
jgi:hypothetical protein